MPKYRNFEAPGRSAAYAPTAMASTSQPLATQTALDILKQGGNALDAAIAACAVQCVTEPQSTGIGGDCFCLYAPAGGQDVVAFNGSGRTPSGLTLDYLQQHQQKLERTSPHSVIVPGAVDAWSQLNADHGRLPMKDLLQPAIGYALQGFPLTPRVARDFGKQDELFASSAALSGIFRPDGRHLASGDRLVQTALGNTLDKIAKEGRDAFYRGEVAEDMVNTLRSLGGVHTMDDFANTRGDYVDPISVDFRGRTVYECPPNGQGVIALLLLNMMSELEVDDNMMSVDRIHLELEACRLAYGVRDCYVADPDHASIPVDELLSADYAKKLCSQIDHKRANETFTVPPLQGAAHQDTVYITVVDEERNACSFINTLFWPFGSGITASKSGVVFTNRAEGFVLDPKSPNCLAPGKRPLHTIIPAMVKQGNNTEMSFGVMGGEYQAMGHMQFLTRVYDYDQDLQQAQDLPRFMVSPFDGSVEVESGIEAGMLQQLTDRGHRVAYAENPIGGSQAISIGHPNGDKTGVLSGGSDPRKDGHAAGY